jgi:hypothetical protein
VALEPEAGTERGSASDADEAVELDLGFETVRALTSLGGLPSKAGRKGTGATSLSSSWSQMVMTRSARMAGQNYGQDVRRAAVAMRRLGRTKAVSDSTGSSISGSCTSLQCLQ